jgi:hypothetical protein
MLILAPSLKAQDSKKGFEFNFSLVHPAKWSRKEYNYSVDPTLEVFYIKSVSKKFWVAGGIYAQAGKHNWKEFTGHTFVDDFGMPYRLRTDYNRQLEFFSLGIPVKIGMEFNKLVLNSLFLGFTVGNHLKLEMADYLNYEYVADLPVTDYYNLLFWELNVGIRKTLLRKENFSLSFSPVAGYRIESSGKDIGNYNYIFYGVGLSSRFGK